MDKPYQYEAPGGRLLSTLVIFVFVIVALYTGFLFFKQSSLNSEIERIATSKTDLETQINQLKTEQVQEVLAAQDLSEKVLAASIKWSKVVKKLQDLTPIGVFYKAYSATKDGSLAVSALGDTYSSVSSVISTIQNSKDFTDVFVPSVTLGATSEGNQLVTFSIQLKSNNAE